MDWEWIRADQANRLQEKSESKSFFDCGTSSFISSFVKTTIYF